MRLIAFIEALENIKEVYGDIVVRHPVGHLPDEIRESDLELSEKLYIAADGSVERVEKLLIIN